jgi:hypothetical protein
MFNLHKQNPGHLFRALNLQTRYSHLSHTSSPFRSGYFGDGVSELFAWSGLELRSSQSLYPK